MNSQQFFNQGSVQNSNDQIMNQFMMMPQMMQQYQHMMKPQNENYQFQNEFPRIQNYQNQQEIVRVYPHLSKIFNNNSEYNIGQCFVIRSSNDDDIHKAIKYNIWTSTPNNNAILEKAYQQAKSQGKVVLLFFSVVKSGQFIGFAKMDSGFINKKFPFWWQSHKFNQQFQLEWQIIKDVSYKQLYHINNLDGNSITRSRDCTELDADNAQLAIEIFRNSNQQFSIFQDFQFMDMREDMLRTQINMQQNSKNKHTDD